MSYWLVTHEDTIEDAKYIANKIANLRLWEDNEGKMNHSILEVGGDILWISSLHCMQTHQKEDAQVLSKRHVLNKQKDYGKHLTSC